MLYWLYDTRASVANELQLEIKKIKEAVVIFRTINNRFGLQILDFLHQNKRSSVKPVYNNLGLQQTVTSSHLTALRKAGLVSSEKEGKFVYYSVNYRRLEEVGEIAEKLLKY